LLTRKRFWPEKASQFVTLQFAMRVNWRAHS
jgi:hypothetical protein